MFFKNIYRDICKNDGAAEKKRNCLNVNMLRSVAAGYRHYFVSKIGVQDMAWMPLFAVKTTMLVLLYG